jgi:hypothetical protein
MSAKIDAMFDYHRPTPEQAERYDKITAKAKEFALLVEELCPDGPDREVAFQKIRESRMTAIASIACHVEK